MPWLNSVALQLYALSLEDWDACLFRLSGVGEAASGSSFLDVVEAAGLESPFSSEAMEILAELWGKVIE